MHLLTNQEKITKMVSREECNQSLLQNITRGWYPLTSIRMSTCRRLSLQLDLVQLPARLRSTDSSPPGPHPQGAPPRQCGQTLGTRTRKGEDLVRRVQSKISQRNPHLQVNLTGLIQGANLQVKKMDICRELVSISFIYLVYMKNGNRMCLKQFLHNL